MESSNSIFKSTTILDFYLLKYDWTIFIQSDYKILNFNFKAILKAS